MLDIQYIRDNPEKVEAAAVNKNREVDVIGILKYDDERKSLISKIQTLREERNTASLEKPPSKETIERGRKIKDKLKEIEVKLNEVEEKLKNLMMYVVNIPYDDVPIGKNQSSNVEVKTCGEIPKFDFEPKDHIELGTNLDIIDLERGSKISGFRGYFLKNQGATLHLALIFYVYQKLVTKGFTPLIPPTVVKAFTLFGSGHFPWGSEQDVYSLNDEDMHLSGTAEIPVTAYHSGEVLNESELPKRYVGLSPCYRREAGAYGKDTKGLYRVHEFWKIEQVIIGKNSYEESLELHEELEKNAEEILQELKLPYRQLLMCTGDMGEPQHKKYDIETWMPGRGTYGETMSNSIMGDFQARRLNIRYKTTEGKTKFCFTYNNTAVASPRILIAILENYQQKNGSVTIPKVLVPFTGFDVIKK